VKSSNRKYANPVLTFWVGIGLVGFFALPWYGVEDFWTFEWIVDGYPWDSDYAPAAFLIAQGEKLWLGPILVPLIAAVLALFVPKTSPAYAKLLVFAGAVGLGVMIAQGFGIGLRGWQFEWLEALFGPLGDRQFGMGYGAMGVATAFLFFLTSGIAARGAVNGDVFVVSSIGFVIAVVGLFVFFPIARMLLSAFITDDGSYSAQVFFEKFTDARLWGLGCLAGGRCGAAWNSLFLAVLVGFITTALGLAFALVVTRSNFRYKKLLRVLTVIPIITPPFVIGLAIILLFGLSGSVTTFFGSMVCPGY